MFAKYASSDGRKWRDKTLLIESSEEMATQNIER